MVEVEGPSEKTNFRETESPTCHECWQADYRIQLL